MRTVKKDIRERLLTGTAWATAGKVASALVGIGITALLARLLSTEGMGNYFLTMSVLSIFALLSQLGLNQAVVRFIGEALGKGNGGRVRDTIRLALRNGAVGSLIGASIFLLFRQEILLTGLHAPELLKLHWHIAIWIAIMTVNGILSEIFRGFHNIKLATLFSGLLSSTSFIIVLVFSYISGIYLGLERVFLFAILSSALSVLLALIFLKRACVTLPKTTQAHIPMRSKDLMDVAWPMWVSGSALLLLSQADILVLGIFRPAAEVAIYGAASRLVALVAMSLVIVNAVIPPIIAELYSQNKRAELEKLLRTTASVAGIPTLGVLVLFIFQGDHLLALVYGEYYAEGGLILTILSVGQLVNVFTGSCGITLTMTGNQTTMMMITLVIGAFTVALALALGSQYGAIGVAVAAASGWTLQNIAMLVGAKIKTGMWTHFGALSLNEIKVLAKRFR